MTAIEFMRDQRSGLLAPGVLELSGAVLPREAEIEGKWLRVLAGDPDDPASSSPSPPTGMLDAFVRLSGGASIANYVMTWGALGICQHGFPAEHDGPRMRLMHLNGWDPELLPSYINYLGVPHNTRGQCRPAWGEWGERGGIYWEPVERYVYFSTQANTILKLAGELGQGRSGSDDDWSRLLGGVPASQIDQSSFSQDNDDPGLRWAILMSAIREWMYLGNAVSTVVWTKTGPDFRLEGFPFGTLGIQMMFAITGKRGLAVCDGCSIAYTRRQKMPKRGQNNYCPSCGSRASSRDSKRKIRARKNKEVKDE